MDHIVFPLKFGIDKEQPQQTCLQSVDRILKVATQLAEKLLCQEVPKSLQARKITLVYKREQASHHLFCLHEQQWLAK